MKKGTENDALRETLIFLEKSAKRNKAPVWSDVAMRLSASRRSRTEVNVGKLAKVTKADDVVVVPGKVLGAGELKHRLTLASWSAANGVAKKVTKAGGKMVSIRELVGSNPGGKGVIIVR